MRSNETISLDPVEFIPQRVELELDRLGIQVRDADWGDSEHELFLVKQKIGEIPADRHPPNRLVTITLRVKEDTGINLAESAQLLQKKVGTFQGKGGWVRRDPDTRGHFSQSVGAVVHSAALSGIQGWQMAHRQVIPDVKLILNTGPYFYGTKEQVTAEFKAKEARQMEYELKDLLGTAPGLFRIRVKNEGGSSWMGCISAMESSSEPLSSVNKFTYQCEDLTMMNTSTVIVKTGAASGKVVSSGPLSGTWTSILDSEIAATSEFMEHVESRRFLIRVYDPNEATKRIKLKLEWRSLGATKWISNDAETTSVVGGYSFVELGTVRPELATLGSQRWEWRILAMTQHEAGEEILLDQVYIIPTEQYAKVKEHVEAAPGGAVIWEDEFLEPEGNVTGQVAPIGGTYEGAGDAADFKGDPKNFRIKRAENKDASLVLGRYLIAGSSKKTYTSLAGTVSNLTNIPAGMKSGFLFRYVNTENWGRVVFERGSYKVGSGSGIHTIQGGNLRVEKCVAGVVKLLAQTGQGADFLDGGSIKITVNTKGEVQAEAVGTEWSKLTFTHTDFATGGALAEGKVGVYDVMTGEAAGSTEPRYYSAVVATTAPAAVEQDAICYAGRSMEFRSDGVFRQHPTVDIWARIIPDGFLPYVPPSGLEEMIAKGLVIPCLGNFEDLADSGSLTFSVQGFYFPGYHFTSEAV